MRPKVPPTPHQISFRECRCIISEILMIILRIYLKLKNYYKTKLFKFKLFILLNCILSVVQSSKADNISITIQYSPVHVHKLSNTDLNINFISSVYVFLSTLGFTVSLWKRLLISSSYFSRFFPLFINVLLLRCGRVF